MTRLWSCQIDRVQSDYNRGFIVTPAGSSLSKGAIAGIVLGCIFGVLLLVSIVAAFILFKGRAARHDDSEMYNLCEYHHSDVITKHI